jgi:eukaryotic-like serine/threonine-protein kinase
VDGSNLADLAAAGHTFSVPEVLSIGRDVGAGLSAIHLGKLVHRDVKPKNVMFDATTQTAVLLDVGIAKHLEVTPVTVGAAPGTYGWRSPEHLRGESVDRRADIYALGLLLYWLASGVHPFANQAHAFGGDIEAAMLGGRFDSVGIAQPALPAPAATMIDQMLSLQPYDRPRNVSAAIAGLI